jgi:hypothetical protein
MLDIICCCKKVSAAYTYIPEASVATLFQQLSRVLLGLWDLFGKLWDFLLLVME